ncbi:MAG: hypothetical protein UY23_C0001G0128 [Candidatus Jorgensenbacteria bacterium GW2011_GWA1_48_11]|uniref:DUF5667 domain-containing protein n=1 Tax=Candidatus Jorgensenbacteria bacterium GW2011_GWA1_48_11 TaxID=1618660 RepID=A0A0G1UBM8_9BACT|nr:MAG: hypothetical protein UY23_C0001G0128 [Candidatus Jorgensenbacteria bacterium GW2011_GWA1_48_11]KKW12015.1 MAG: hypothetical protein UY51_C0005G0257 [Candidatus Jorgensenbacteria bacterium GW2011_GWB1_49_9]
MKNFLIGLLLISLSQISVAEVSAAQDGQSGVQQAFTAVQNSIDDLITAKDQGSADDLALRLQAFKKVIGLSVSETKNLKVKLLSANTDNNKDIQAWQKNMTAALDRALNYYDDQGQELDQIDNLDLETIKNLASDFKAWRDENYLPIADQINSFVLIQEERNAISVAEKRAQKIGIDIKNLPKAKNFSPGTMLADAKNKISESKKLNGKAYDLFLSQFVEIKSSSTAPAAPDTKPAATSSIDVGSLTPVTLNPDNASSTVSDNASTTAGTNASSNAANTAANASSTEVSPPPPPSIKDLIKASLNKIKDAYQVFIEMSNSVRKLLS